MTDSVPLSRFVKDRPLKWKRASLRYRYRDAFLSLERANRSESLGAYYVLVRLQSERFERFLSAVKQSSEFVEKLPKVRHTLKSPGPATLGQASFGIHLPGYVLDKSMILISEPYSERESLVPIGFDTLSEKRFCSFLAHVDDLLNSSDGLYRAHERNGFINCDLGHFDIFWSYIFAAALARLPVEECARRIFSDVGAHYARPINAPDASFVDSLYRIALST
ncbi:hypothetical protein OEW28_10405 [Defluviimonas sp. WL0002]|uniref:YaaC-like protein n=1 Tax=Albidovulum marisflavi TaxID=2984159 RepID=A0ABT2ZD36_9RHOB|nr:hypothetical protein [Defluviimonas sp. WL0002]MCV2869037.1 hypothetical protein [Defluviimonas sp. WL0002]